MTAIVKQDNWGMTREQLDLLKRTVAEGTTDDEFALFMTTAQRLGLDPFARQIYAVKRPSWDRQLGRYVDKMAIQVGIDGFRSVADRTQMYSGQDGPFWCGDDGVWRDVWLKDEPPSGARVVVYKRGCEKPFTGIATYRSYVQTNKDGKANRQWEQMPDVMLAKCAEALALRKAFPSQLSGVYAPEEMGQSENGAPTSAQRDLLPAGPQVDSTLADIAIAPSIEALKALAPKLSKLPEAMKAEARTKYRERMHLLQQGAAA